MPDGFVNPFFLLGLAGLSVPVILHLMHRQTPRKVVFPAIRFIRKGQREQSGRKGLRDLFTLLLRLLLLTLAVLLFAQPFRAVEAPPPDAGSRRIVLFYDLSASMRAATWPAYARVATARLMRDDPSASFAMVASSDRVDRLVPFGAGRGEISAAVDALRPTLRPGSHGAALRAAASLYASEDPQPVTVYIFSDLQRRDWGGVNLTALLPGAQVEFVRPERDDRNAAIIAVAPELFTAGDQRRVRATVQVRNYDLAAYTGSLSLSAGNRDTRQEIEVPADSTARFVLDLENPGGREGAVRLEPGDQYPLDDAYHCWLGAQPPIRVGLVVAKGDGDGLLGAWFLRKALETTMPGVPRFEPRMLPSDFAMTADLGSLDAVFLFDAGLDGAMNREILKAWVEQGGCLVYVPGDAASTNLRELRQSGLTGLRFAGMQGHANAARSQTIAGFDRQAPVTALFASEPADLQVFPIHRYVRLEAPEAARVLATLPGDRPFLVREDRGNGTVFTFAVNFSANWSEWPTSVSFLPLLRRLLEEYGAGPERGIVNLHTGADMAAQALEAGLPADAVPPAEPGVYLFGKRPVQVNHTRAESDLRAASEFEVASADGGIAALAGAEEEAPRHGYARWLGLLLLAILIGEIVIANWRTTGKTGT